MNRRFIATMELQRPDYRDPADLIGHDVCPHCTRRVTSYRFTATDGHWIETHYCPEHGDVVPMRSHIVCPW